MNIALIRPQKIRGAFEKILIQEPINLAYLGAHLQASGFTPVIWDFEVEEFSEEILKEKIRKEKITIAGITAMTPTIKNAHQIAQIIRKSAPMVKTIIGGPHVSAIPEQTMRDFPAFDYAVIGEGEITFSELVKTLVENKDPALVPGIFYRDKAGLASGSPGRSYKHNLDELPMPDRSLLKKELYGNLYAAGIDSPGKKGTVVFTSRGCSQNCTFCAVKKTMGEKTRFRSAENVIAELVSCKENFGYNHITFEDTNLTLNPERFWKICQALKKLNLTWDCQTRVNLVTSKMLSEMKDCGCLKVAFGVESGSQRILDLMHKNIKISEVETAFHLTRKAGIISCAFFILGGHPEENEEDIAQTEKLLHRIKPDVFQLGIICPYPGTEICEIMKKENLISSMDWDSFNFMHAVPAWGTKYLKAQDLVRLQKKIYLGYLFRIDFLGKTIFKMLRPSYFLRTIKLAKEMINYLVFEKRIRNR